MMMEKMILGASLEIRLKKQSELFEAEERLAYKDIADSGAGNKAFGIVNSFVNSIHRFCIAEFFL